MPLTVWTQPSGYRFDPIQESTEVSIDLPVLPGLIDVNYSVISGSLPPGLRLSEDNIIGSAFEVSRETEFKFVIRAEKFGQISDRTFYLTVQGPDISQWVTPEGALPVFANMHYYILDGGFVDLQLSAVDFDTSADQSLKFFIASKDGKLPPGLTLTESGRIFGFVEPAFTVPANSGSGTYDQNLYDFITYDFAVKSANGYDSFTYDSRFFDYSTTSVVPKKLNRNYQFTVTLTDGDTSTRRTFRIYVVTDDLFRADSTIMHVGSDDFTADVSYVRPPIWTTNAFLGTYRSNNYQTFKLDIYEGVDLGLVEYRLLDYNLDDSGTLSNVSNIENSRLGFNPTSYKLRKGQYITITGNLVTGNLQIGGVTIADKQVYYVGGATTTSCYLYATKEKAIKGLEADRLTISGTTVTGATFVYSSSTSSLPPGMQFDPTSSEVFGYIPYQAALTETYKFTVSAIRYGDRSEYAISTRTFTVKITGEIESAITWITNQNLGSIDANIPCTLSVKAKTSLTNSLVTYKLISGSLPPGLSFTNDGEIIGKPRQYPSTGLDGITTFYEADEFDNKTIVNQTFDGNTTTFDRIFTFTISASDTSVISASERTFSLQISVPDDRRYSNITVKPFLKLNQRDLFKSFINDRTVFDVGTIYRPNDPNFGLQSELRMLVYAGIETTASVDIVSKIGLNHRKKRFKLGTLKKAQAKLNGSGETIYEVVYIEAVDPLETNGKYLPYVIGTSVDDFKITVDQNNSYYNGPFDTLETYWNPPQPFNSTLDRTDVFAGDPGNYFRFPSSITLWRKRIKSLGLRQPKYLPLWMRTIQDGSVQELGYVPAIPLCYCKPGTADTIIENIKYSGFDFQQLDYEIDRYIIDQTLDYNGDKYFVFRNDRTTIS